MANTEKMATLQTFFYRRSIVYRSKHSSSRTAQEKNNDDGY